MKKVVKHLIDKVYLTEDGIVYLTDMPYKNWKGYDYYIADGMLYYQGECDMNGNLDFFRSTYRCNDIKDITDYLHLIL